MLKIEKGTVPRFLNLVLPFFRSEVGRLALGMVILLFTLSLMVNSLGFIMSYFGRDFMTALNVKDSDRFYIELLKYLAAFAVATPIVVYYTYTEQRLGIMWRRWLSNHILKKYFARRAYYRLNLTSEIDNPDQRIEEDVRSFCSQTLTFSLIIFNSLVQLCLYVWLLWQISWILFVVAVGYALLGSVTTYLLGRPLIGLNFKQLKREADYRYKLINVRDSAESIAFYGDEKKEFTRTRQRLKVALNNLLEVVNWNRNLQFFTTGYNYILAILPTVIVAPLFFNGQIEFGSVIQAGVAFGFVINALSIIVNHFGSISVYLAVVNRLGTFWEALERAQLSSSEQQQISVTRGDSAQFKLQFNSVTILTPNREQLLIEQLTFNFDERSLLICGPSGSGKTSVLRVIAGLWSTGSGAVSLPDLSKAMFIPQRPYMVLGSLRSQLLYGTNVTVALDQKLNSILAQVNLSEMLERVGGLDATLDWPNVLGTGEQQRLAFARVLLARPELVFLDEATTAIDRETEELLYSLLLEHGSRYISTGNRATIGQFHKKVLELSKGGKWRFE